jgi:hypothetical protein
MALVHNSVPTSNVDNGQPHVDPPRPRTPVRYEQHPATSQSPEQPRSVTSVEAAPGPLPHAVGLQHHVPTACVFTANWSLTQSHQDIKRKHERKQEVLDFVIPPRIDSGYQTLSHTSGGDSKALARSHAEDDSEALPRCPAPGRLAAGTEHDDLFTQSHVSKFVLSDLHLGESGALDNYLGAFTMHRDLDMDSLFKDAGIDPDPDLNLQVLADEGAGVEKDTTVELLPATGDESVVVESDKESALEHVPGQQYFIEAYRSPSDILTDGCQEGSVSESVGNAEWRGTDTSNQGSRKRRRAC